MAQISVDIERGPDEGEPQKAGRHPNTCPVCHSHYRDDELVAALRVCRQCGYHFPVGARERIAQLTDDGSFSETAADLRSADPLAFVDLRPYTERLSEAELATGLGDAIVVGTATVGGRSVALAVMDFGFLAGSMGSVVGEKFALAADLAVAHGVPFVSVASSGGARMQENILALMQMAKTVMAVDAVRDARLPYISICAHPTTGGVIASFAALGDIILAEPGALMSFAGPRVVQQTTRRDAAGGLRPGRVAAAARPRRRGGAARRADGDARAACSRCSRRRRSRAERRGARRPSRAAGAFGWLRRAAGALGVVRVTRGGPRASAGDSRSAARSRRSGTSCRTRGTRTGPTRSTTRSACSATPTSCTATARPATTRRSWPASPRYHGRPVVFVGHQKGRDLAERTHRNFGMARPEGYRKAIRAIELADRLGYPIITFIDTPGAYPGVGAEQARPGGHDRALDPRAGARDGAGGVLA